MKINWLINNLILQVIDGVEYDTSNEEEKEELVKEWKKMKNKSFYEKKRIKELEELLKHAKKDLMKDWRERERETQEKINEIETEREKRIRRKRKKKESA